MADQQTYKFTGSVHMVFDAEQRSEKFKTRNFVLILPGEYPQYIQFQAVNERCDILDTLSAGDTVAVNFDLRGREWNGKYLTNLNAWKVEKLYPASRPLPAAEKFPEPTTIEPLPF